MSEMTSPTGKDLRAAQLASVLAAGVRSNDLHRVDALRVIRHEMRTRNTNKKLGIRPRSVAAQAVIDDYAARSLSVPRNDSPDAMHADHVFALRSEELDRLLTVDDWLEALARFRQVVCVTADENYRLEQLEKAGTDGWRKYETAGITWAAD